MMLVDVRWTWRGARSYVSYMYTLNLEASFLLVKMAIPLTSDVQNCGRVLNRAIQCVVLAVWPFPPTSNLMPFT